jgi:PilZ domain
MQFADPILSDKIIGKAANSNGQIPYEQAALEDRSAPRIKLSIPASLRPSGSPGFSVIIRDLSISGFAAEALTSMKPGTRVWIKIPTLSALQSKIEWNDGFVIGCSFDVLLNACILESILSHYRTIENR